jgi:hypothetical protein
VPAPRTNIIIDALNVHRGLNLIGSSGGSIIPHLHIPKYLNYIKRNPTNFYKIISKTINLKDAPEIIRKMSLGTNRAGRNIIKF